MKARLAAFMLLLLMPLPVIAGETNLPPITVTWFTNHTTVVVRRSNVTVGKIPLVLAEKTDSPRNLKITIQGEPGTKVTLFGDCTLPSTRVLVQEIVIPDSGIKIGGVGFPTSDFAFVWVVLQEDSPTALSGN